MKRKHKLWALPTDKKSKLHLVPKGEWDGEKYIKEPKWLYVEESTEFGYPPYHLYITSDEEIKGGDWHYNKNLNRIIREDWYGDLVSPKFECYKIVATTNPELHWKQLEPKDWTYGGPQKIPLVAKIPEDFVAAFAKQQGNITEVMLEWDNEHTKACGTRYRGCSPDCNFHEPKLKLRPNGTVHIFPVSEKKYSLDEVINLISSYVINTSQDAEATQYDFPNLFKQKKEEVTNWFNTHYNEIHS